MNKLFPYLMHDIRIKLRKQLYKCIKRTHLFKKNNLLSKPGKSHLWLENTGESILQNIEFKTEDNENRMTSLEYLLHARYDPT